MVLRIKKTKNLNLICCVLLAVWLCLAQVLANSPLILGCLLCFMALILVSAWNGTSTPVLLFFLPFAPLLKLEPDTMTFYTFALIFVCLITFFRRKCAVNIYCAILALILAVLTLCSLALDRNRPTTSYILLLFMLLLFPGVMNELREKVDFKQLTLYFSLGIILSALSAQQLLGYRTISRYITVDSWTNVYRLSGYYGDPNFYSAQITAAISGVLVLFLRETKRGAQLWLILIGVLLMYCGFLSGSKAFLLTVLLVGVLWLFRFLSMRGRISRKVLILLLLVLVVTAAVASGLFSEQWETFMHRFRYSSSLSALTTGRTDLWRSYGSALMGSAKLLLLGKGFVNDLVGNTASHNTLIQLVYQLGIPGFLVMLLWAYFCIRGTLRYHRVKSRPQEMLILMVGIFLPWLALDMMFFDEFFLMPLYALAGFIFCGGTCDRTAPMIHKKSTDASTNP